MRSHSPFSSKYSECKPGEQNGPARYPPAAMYFLEKYEYASRPHVLLALLWHTMMRVGAAHALDVDDYDTGDQLLAIHHRPDTGTPIKNKANGERLVPISDKVCSLLDDQIETQRPDVTDEYGREPLLATTHGRAHRGTLRSDCYRFTRLCIVRMTATKRRVRRSITSIRTSVLRA